MSARDEFPVQRVTFNGPAGTETVPYCPTIDKLWAALDALRVERDTLTAEVERLNANNVLLHTDGQQLVREIAELTRQRDAACLTRNQLHVENVRLTAERNDMCSECMDDLAAVVIERDTLTAQLAELRAAVTLWQWAIGDPKAMVVAEATLIGLARSWETEQ